MIQNLSDIYDNVDFENHLRQVTVASDLSTEDQDHRIIQLFNKSGRTTNAVYGNHHQAIDLTKAGEGLKTLLVWNLPGKTFIPYALYDNTYKAGAWLFQFHPEVKEEMGAAMSRQLANLNSELYDSFFELIAKDTKQIATRPTAVDRPVTAEQPTKESEKIDPKKVAAQPPQTDEQPTKTTEPADGDEQIQQPAEQPMVNDEPIKGTKPVAEDKSGKGDEQMPTEEQPSKEAEATPPADRPSGADESMPTTGQQLASGEPPATPPSRDETNMQPSEMQARRFIIPQAAMYPYICGYIYYPYSWLVY